jgi:hypothetical protein
MALSLSLLVNSQLLLTLFTPEEEVEAVEVEEMSDHRPLINSRSLLPSFSETESKKRRGLKESDSHQLDQELLPSSQAEINKSVVGLISDSGVRSWTRIKTNLSGSPRVWAPLPTI